MNNYWLQPGRASVRFPHSWSARFCLHDVTDRLARRGSERSSPGEIEGRTSLISSTRRRHWLAANAITPRRPPPRRIRVGYEAEHNRCREDHDDGVEPQLDPAGQ